MQPSREIIAKFGLVYVKMGKVRLGTNKPIPCQLEGYRHNETPQRVFMAGDFWIARWAISNKQYEQFKPQHLRSHLSRRDKSPVVNVTYLDAISYCQWLTDKFDLGRFDLPDEVEWSRAASLDNHVYPYHQSCEPVPQLAHTFRHEQSNSQNISTQKLLDVNKELYPHPLGLVHITGNILEITKGWYYAPGHFGSATDGAYYVAKGGDIKHCALSGGVQPRYVYDVATRLETIGFRVIWKES